MPTDNEPNAERTAAIATLLLTAGAMMEDASVAAAAARMTIDEVSALAAVGTDIAALTAAAAVLARVHRDRRT
jgi:hypothetical protein